MYEEDDEYPLLEEIYTEKWWEGLSPERFKEVIGNQLINPNDSFDIPEDFIDQLNEVASEYYLSRSQNQDWSIISKYLRRRFVRTLKLDPTSIKLNSFDWSNTELHDIDFILKMRIKNIVDCMRYITLFLDLEKILNKPGVIKFGEQNQSENVIEAFYKLYGDRINHIDFPDIYPDYIRLLEYDTDINPYHYDTDLLNRLAFIKYNSNKSRANWSLISNYLDSNFIDKINENRVYKYDIIKTFNPNIIKFRHVLGSFQHNKVVAKFFLKFISLFKIIEVYYSDISKDAKFFILQNIMERNEIDDLLYQNIKRLDLTEDYKNEKFVKFMASRKIFNYDYWNYVGLEIFPVVENIEDPYMLGFILISNIEKINTDDDFENYFRHKSYYITENFETVEPFKIVRFETVLNLIMYCTVPDDYYNYIPDYYYEILRHADGNYYLPYTEKFNIENFIFFYEQGYTVNTDYDYIYVDLIIKNKKEFQEIIEDLIDEQSTFEIFVEKIIEEEIFNISDNIFTTYTRFEYLNDSNNSIVHYYYTLTLLNDMIEPRETFQEVEEYISHLGIIAHKN